MGQGANKRTTVGVVAAAILVMGSALFVHASPTREKVTAPLNIIACINSAGVIESTHQGLTPQTCAHSYDRRVSWPVGLYPPPTTTTTTRPSTTTTSLGLRRCFGTPMTLGQADIDSHGTNTIFCLSGTHNWSLTPKTGDQIISDPFNPGILDGAGAAAFALDGSANNVVLDGIEVRNYIPGNAAGAVRGLGSGWILRNLQVHDNGQVCPTAPNGCHGDGGTGGSGSRLGTSWQIVGGRYYNNRQNGITGGGGGNSTIDGAEVDHNNFTNDNYTTENISCDFEAGGVKWVTNGNTIKNSYIHDNGCRGLWSDIGATGITIDHNTITNNWAEGVFIEISGSADITNNAISGNGLKTQFMNFNGCTWGEGGGITISASGHTNTTPTGQINITGNTVTSNCAALTGIEELRTSTLNGACSTGDPCQLRHLDVSGNTFTGSTNPLATNYIGWFKNDGQDLTTHDITFGSNTLANNINNCQFTCGDSTPTFIFDDEFNGASGAAPDSSKWANNPSLCSQFGDNNSCMKTYNAFTDGSGDLILRIKRDGSTASGFSGALIATYAWGSSWPASGVKASLTIPYHFEARAKMPNTPGAWSALWTENVTPASNSNQYELDIAEERMSDPTAAGCHQHQWTHGGLPDIGGWDGGVGVSNMATNWHVYSADVYSDHVNYFVDGVSCGTAPGVTAGGAHGIIIDSVLGAPGSWGADGGAPAGGDPGPWDMTIDYVRVSAL